MVNQASYRKCILAAAVIVGACALVHPSPAGAHFILQAPASLQSQDVVGSPQKAPPCGDEGGGSPTFAVTTYQTGQTITVTVDETVFHPGHYRVALGLNGPGDLPPEPLVTAGSSACGSVPIENPPAFPVLADGMLLHTEPFSGPQSFQVTLPANVTCDKCTLQVIEFMSSHPLNNPGGCFYHHCADIKIEAASGAGGAGSAGDTAASSSTVGGTQADASVASGAGCSFAMPRSWDGAILLALGLATFRRRARAS